MTKKLQLKVIDPGIQTTIQDRGREAYRAFGVPKAGPMDVKSAQFANKLVGNTAYNPVMEFTLKGPVIELQGEGYLSLTGGLFAISLDGESIPQNKVVAIKGKHRLSIENAQSGCRGYLAVAGSWKLRSWLGSCSTSPQNGAELTPDSLINKGTTINVIYGGESFPKLSPRQIPAMPAKIRIIAGPEYHLFSTQVVKTLLRRWFIISSQSNRMGYRLETPLTDYQAPLEVISSGVVPGTIQVTHSGQLIVLMADAQTTGGYPRIANVISEDLDKLAQMKPGDRFKLGLVSLSEAYEAM